MKRGTRAWLEMHARSTSGYERERGADALATYAEVKRLRRENRELMAANQRLIAFKVAVERAALARVKEHHCGTSSSDEQVLCDDTKCPRSRYFKGKRHG